MNLVQLQEIGLLTLVRLIPLALSVVVALVSLMPLEPSELILAIGAMVMLGILVFWTLVRSDDVPPLSIFLSGLIFDSAGGGPLGLWALSFLVGSTVTRLRAGNERGTSKFVSLVTFAFATALGGSTAWIAASLYTRGLIDPSPLIVGAWASTAVFLVLLGLFGAKLEMPTRYMDRV